MAGYRGRFIVLAGTLAAIGVVAPAARAGTIKVDTTADQHGAQASKCALREAVVAANTDADFGGCNDSNGDDTVVLGAKRYKLTRDGADEQMTATGDLDVTADLRIRGDGAGKTILDGNKDDRVIDTPTPVELRISDLTVTGGKTPQFSGGGISGAAGAASALTLDHSVIRGNFGAGGGGGVVAGGTVKITNSRIEGNRSGPGTAGGGYSTLAGAKVEIDKTTIAGNKSATFGAGVYANNAEVTVTDSVVHGNKALDGEAGGFAQLAGVLEIADTVIKGNSADGPGAGVYGLSTTIRLDRTTLVKNKASEGGGGLFVESPSTLLELDRTTVSANRAGEGGGGLRVSNSTTTLLNSTVSGNKSDETGGGIHVTGSGDNADVSLFNVTVADNVADADDAGGESGGGVFRADGLVQLQNSVLGNNRALAGDPAEPDCDGGIVATYTLIENDCPGLGSNNVVGVDPKLKPLKGNGGTTRTHALKASSPALEAANPATPGSTGEACPTIDQREKPRPGGTLCDMGAYERQ